MICDMPMAGSKNDDLWVTLWVMSLPCWKPQVLCVGCIACAGISWPCESSCRHVTDIVSMHFGPFAQCSRTYWESFALWVLHSDLFFSGESKSECSIPTLQDYKTLRTLLEPFLLDALPLGEVGEFGQFERSIDSALWRIRCVFCDPNISSPTKMHQSSRDGRTLILSFKFQDQLWTLRHWPPFHLHCLMNSPGKGHWCRGTGVGTHHCKDFFWMFLQGFPSWLQFPEWMEIGKSIGLRWVESFFSKKCVEVSPAFQHSSSHHRCQRRLIPTPLVLPADEGGISMSIRPCVSHVISPVVQIFLPCFGRSCK